jgi:hypothetical protein
MQNFYLSVYRQSLARGLSDEFVSAFVIDFCDFQKQSFVSGAWEKMMAEGKLSSSHQEMRAEWCGF